MKHECWAELIDVRKRFGKVIALDGVDLQLRAGELFALLGQNGAGKTTAISLLLGLEQPDSGKALLFGRSPLELAARREIGVMMQESALVPELRVREQIELVASYYRDPMTPRMAMQLTHTEALAERPYGKLSGGQKRQVQFALAICGRAKLLFLDEPTVGLDIQSRELMWSTLRTIVSQGASIVLTTHYLEEAEALADRVAVLAKGRVIASGTVNEMRALVVRKQISCSSSLSVERIRTWKDVESVRRDHRGLEITARNVEGIVRRLFQEDEDLQDLEIHRAGLAQIFTKLTQESVQ
jgi:ABC-2 type transport system ATP-binding protein